ncbi:MAG: DUF4366 domain-containing protein [Lachnospiraceae bacterium]|nr:DUF4366 domain-containing protein [Lachnospiraceae bacterium]
MSKDKMEDLIEMSKLGDILGKKDSKTNPLVVLLAVIGGVAVVALIAYAVFRFMTPDYFDDYDDDEDEEFESDEDEEDPTGDAVKDAVREATEKA